MMLESKLIVGLLHIGVGVYHAFQKSQLSNNLPTTIPEPPPPGLLTSETGYFICSNPDARELKRALAVKMAIEDYP